MQVVLLERIPTLGDIGAVVDVKNGYARNFLLPQNKALRATKDNIAYFEAQKASLLAANEERRTKAEADAKKIDGKKFVLIRQASEVGVLFGSINARDVAEAAAEQGFTVRRADVKLDQGIKSLGVFPIKISPHPDVTVEVIINIARSQEEAAEQFKTGKAVIRQGGEAPKASKAEKAGTASVDSSAPSEPTEEAASA